jgi:hypothetical protein
LKKSAASIRDGTAVRADRSARLGHAAAVAAALARRAAGVAGSTAARLGRHARSALNQAAAAIAGRAAVDSEIHARLRRAVPASVLISAFDDEAGIVAVVGAVEAGVVVSAACIELAGAPVTTACCNRTGACNRHDQDRPKAH